MIRTVELRHRSLRTLLLSGAVLALLLQSLTPPGYMPGSLSSGWPVVLCPEGLPAGFLGHDHHHHDDAGSGGTAHSDRGLGQHCPLGGMLDAGATTSFGITSSAAGALDPVWDHGYLTPVLARRTSSHLTRGPPGTG